MALKKDWLAETDDDLMGFLSEYTKYSSVSIPNDDADSGAGYNVGDIWHHTTASTTPEWYVCLDNTAGSARWHALHTPKWIRGFGADYPDANDDLDLGYDTGSRAIGETGAREFVCVDIGASDNTAQWAQTNVCKPSSSGAAVHFWDKTTAPGVNDDLDVGAAQGSFWFDTTAGKAYVCLDPSNGAADWNQIDAAGGGGGGSTLEFTPVSFTNNDGDYGTSSVGSTGSCYFSGYIPSSITPTSWKVYGIPTGTGVNEDIDLASDYAAPGTSKTTGGESNLSQTPSYTANQVVEFDVSSVFTSFTSGKAFGLQIDHNGIGHSIGYLCLIVEG